MEGGRTLAKVSYSIAFCLTYIFFESLRFECMTCIFLGDSGGPLIIPGTDASEDVQIGVVSWGNGCAYEGYPGVYSRMSSGFNWIKKTVCEESSLPPTDFCEASYSPTETPTTYFPTSSPRPSETSTDYPTVTGCEINSGGKMHFVDPAEDSDVHDIVGGTEVRQLYT